ncbi:hypothetical protein VTN00DRAFT_6953 [Thermoascus crustaceus]|uniref:uncharacterized protein n=1 Tax=Thermoascus crustaceus TaxID=5088 RepID=UPI003743C92D
MDLKRFLGGAPEGDATDASLKEIRGDRCVRERDVMIFRSAQEQLLPKPGRVDQENALQSSSRSSSASESPFNLQSGLCPWPETRPISTGRGGDINPANPRATLIILAHFASRAVVALVGQAARLLPRFSTTWSESSAANSNISIAPTPNAPAPGSQQRFRRLAYGQAE